MYTQSPFDWGHSPEKVQDLYELHCVVVGCSLESGCLRTQPELGGKLHLRLNSTASPIANKYREGKLQRTLKREFKSA